MEQCAYCGVFGHNEYGCPKQRHDDAMERHARDTRDAANFQADMLQAHFEAQQAAAAQARFEAVASYLTQQFPQDVETWLSEAGDAPDRVMQVCARIAESKFGGPMSLDVWARVHARSPYQFTQSYDAVRARLIPHIVRLWNDRESLPAGSEKILRDLATSFLFPSTAIETGAAVQKELHKAAETLGQQVVQLVARERQGPEVQDYGCLQLLLFMTVVGIVLVPTVRKEETRAKEKARQEFEQWCNSARVSIPTWSGAVRSLASKLIALADPQLLEMAPLTWVNEIVEQATRTAASIGAPEKTIAPAPLEKDDPGDNDAVKMRKLAQQLRDELIGGAPTLDQPSWKGWLLANLPGGSVGRRRVEKATDDSIVALTKAVAARVNASPGQQIYGKALIRFLTEDTSIGEEIEALRQAVGRGRPAARRKAVKHKAGAFRRALDNFMTNANKPGENPYHCFVMSIPEQVRADILSAMARLAIAGEIADLITQRDPLVDEFLPRVESAPSPTVAAVHTNAETVAPKSPSTIRCPKCSKAYKLRGAAKPKAKFRCKQCDFAAPFELLRYADVRPASELFNTLAEAEPRALPEEDSDLVLDDDQGTASEIPGSSEISGKVTCGNCAKEVLASETHLCAVCQRSCCKDCHVVCLRCKKMACVEHVVSVKGREGHVCTTCADKLRAAKAGADPK
jgi:hypothetical protein